jgi:PIN domain
MIAKSPRMPNVLYLFSDTNAFVQCRPLEQVDWSGWKEFDEVHLIVSRPVQVEIDNQKNKGSDRLGNRARTTSRMFRELIVADSDHKVIREVGPCVKLFIRQDLKPSPELADRLSYEERDDQLVGITHAFAQRNPGADVRVLTHDTGPMASARMIGVAFVAIPDDWLLPPETNEAEKKIAVLQAELTRLKKAAPAFRITCVDVEGNAIDKIEIEAARYAPLNNDHVTELMERLKQRFPIATDFGAREPAERDAKGFARAFFQTKEIFAPATDDEIASYKDEAYPKWFESCERTLRGLHQFLEVEDGVPTFRFAVTNDGARPAKDALITIEAKGDFAIMAPKRNDDAKEVESKPIALPSPPAPPQGKWRLKPFADMLQSAIPGAMGVRARLVTPDFAGAISGLRDFDRRRDPNGLYWKPHRPTEPVSTLNLECEQWRHGVEPELFDGQIYFGTERDFIAGALECRIHAENLTDIALIRVPVRIQIRQADAYETAKALVQRLVDDSPG